MRTVVFINSHSRRSSRHLDEVREFFDTHEQFELIDYIVVDNLKAFDKYLGRLRSHSKIDRVIVGGGDGTIMAVINALKDRKDIVYGFLPLGTTNVFARNLDLPLDLKKSLKLIAKEHTRMVNLGSINGVLFLSVASAGLSVEVTKRLTNRTKRFLGPFAYYLSALKILFRYTPPLYELTIGDDIVRVQTYELVILNGRYYGPTPLTKSGSVYNDKLTVFYSTGQSRFGFLNDAHSFVVGLEHKRKNVSIISAEEFTLRTKRPEAVEAEGEIVGKTPAEIRLVKDAIRVLVPAEKQTLANKLHKTRP